MKLPEMTGRGIANASTLRLSILVGLYVTFQIAFAIISVLQMSVPNETTIEIIVDTQCKDSSSLTSGNFNQEIGQQWYYSYGKDHCHPIESSSSSYSSIDNIVYVFQTPLPRDDKIFEYTKWHQYLTATLMMDDTYSNSNIPMMLDVKLAGKNLDDPDDNWKLIATTEPKGCNQSSDVNTPTISIPAGGTILLFKLDTINYDTYLINIRLPGGRNKDINDEMIHLYLILTHQNAEFTRQWITVELLFCLATISSMIIYWIKVMCTSNSVTQMDFIMTILGLTVFILNLPLEALTLYFDYNIPHLALLINARQDLFYAGLLTFWILFVNEHVLEKSDEKTAPPTHDYTVYFAISLCVLSLFILQSFEHILHFTNPFMTIWNNCKGHEGPVLLVIVVLCAGMYLVILSDLVSKALKSMTTMEGDVSKIRKRLQAVIIVTLFCAVLTVLDFVLRDVAKIQWLHDWNFALNIPSRFTAGFYTMWNIYALSLLLLYAPTKKGSSIWKYAQMMYKDEKEMEKTVRKDENLYLNSANLQLHDGIDKLKV